MIKNSCKILLILIISLLSSCIPKKYNITANELQNTTIEVIKGVAYNHHITLECKEINSLNGKWFYNWWYETNSNNSEFVPMIFSHYQTTGEIITNIISQKPKAVLTWNEPTVVD